MVEHHAQHLDTVFHALGDATRRGMLRALSDGDRTVSELAAPLDMSLAAASKHIKVLEQAGLLRREVKGAPIFAASRLSPLASVQAWLNFYEQFWTARLDVLDRLLRDDDQRQSPKTKGDRT